MPEGQSPELFALDAASLQHLDRGVAAAALKSAIESVVKDCIDRPSDSRARSVTLSFSFVPVVETVDNVVSCEGARGTYKVRAKIPDYESRTLDFGVRKPGLLVFNSNSPANHRQATFLDGPDDPADRLAAE